VGGVFTFTVLLAALLVGTPAFAVGVIAPIPRLPAEKLLPAAQPPADPDDPAAILDRITKSADAIGDRLKDKDTGADTRKQQEQLLKDIDALLKPPPPMDGGSGGANMPPPMGSGDMPPPMGGAGMPPPMGGGSGGGRQRPPRGSRGEGQPMPMGAGGMKEPMSGSPMPMGTGTKPGQPAGGTSGPGSGKASPPSLPLDVPIAKEVWGHLPEKARQEVSQYYREQYLPRYNDLLKQYYTALAERERKGK